jgi:hypothetical protein
MKLWLIDRLCRLQNRLRVRSFRMHALRPVADAVVWLLGLLDPQDLGYGEQDRRRRGES